jgi:uncharacterized protein YjiS (DUF1127 family)
MTRGHPASSTSTAGRDAPPSLRVALARTGALLRAWIARSRQRRALADLDDRLLRDVGIDRAAARREIDKPIWRP